MANTKSAKKRIGILKKKTARNRSRKSELNTKIKTFKAAPNTENFKEVTSLLDRAAQDSLIHRNKANRIKIRLASMVTQ
jgi:small subunit ribosomal protein S20